MFSKVKDTTRSMVQEVRNNLDPSKRNSMDAKRKNSIIDNNTMPNMISPNNTDIDNNHQHQKKNSTRRSLSFNRKGVPIVRPFTIQKEGSSSELDEEDDESLYTTSIETTGHYLANEEHREYDPTTAETKPLGAANQDNATTSAAPFDAAALARADVLCGSERPGILATACELELAKQKKNEEFHSIFKTIDENDILIDVYKCALQKDILLQGHLYVSEQHVCFKSNIFGFVTNLVVKYSEIVKIEKRMTALIIPNGILIETEAATHIFASLLCRDQAYDQMVKIWDLRKKASSITPSIAIPAEASAHDADDEENHNDMTSVVLPAAANDNHDDLALPNDTTILAASSPDSAIMLNTPPLLITDKDSFEQHQKDLIEQQRLQKAAASLEEEIENDKEQVGITKEAGVDTSHSSPGHDTTLNGAAREKDTFLATKLEEQQRPRAASDSNTTPADTSVLTKPRTTTNGTSRLNLTASPALAMNNTLSQGKKPMKVVPLKKSRVCPCTINNEQYHHVALNEIYTGTVEAMFKLLCDSDFLRNFLERYEAFEDVQDGEWRHGRREVTGKRRVKSATSGTKIVKVLFQEKKAHRKFPYYCCITATKSMPDMPMDAIYSIQSRTCITRVHRDKVHVLLTFQVAFTQSNFTSSIIEKNAAADQFRLYNRLNAVLHRPDLIQELLAKDPNSDYILHSLQIPTKAEEEQRINAIEKRKWSYILCIGLIAILLTHSMLAFRLRRIVRHIEVIKAPSQHPYQKPISAPVEHKPSFHDEHSLFDGNIEEVQWVDSQLKQIEKRLSFLQSEASAYNERLRSLKQEFD